ncbi:shikimate kinase [Coraliomargarita parva]|uniref:shikimate kinase n=1 Tax=Coraliomargarita parva TaxID=3014050 RepID=UPI0022B2F114|nr:shikimate kinase [Coraliomargarita parva]
MKSLKQNAMPNLYLVGFMGVGKSVIGRRVARALGFRFYDSDAEIEKKAGKSIPQIFESEGEAAFRAYERAYIEAGHPARNCVVSCGGGLVVQPGMRELLRSKGVVVCLFASVESILERTGRNKNRPLLNVANPEAKIRQLLSEREPIYMDAGPCISTDGRSIAEVVQHLERTYRSCAKDPRRCCGKNAPEVAGA